jgi:uncharacterized protein (TIGR02145 family)
MAQNLNFQSGLTFTDVANIENTDLLGRYWCPAPQGAAKATAAACTVWGALYSWETAMLYNGQKTTWTEDATYHTGAANAGGALYNHGRKANGDRQGSGICPEGWHVPTENEWAKIWDVLDGQGSVYQTATLHTYVGAAGPAAKSICYIQEDDVKDINDISYIDSGYADQLGIDLYGLRILAAGYGVDFQSWGCYT